MKVLKGLPVSPGIGMGKVILLQPEKRHIPLRPITAKEIPAEELKYRKAVDKTIAQIEALGTRFADGTDIKYKAIFEAHIAILSDPTLHKKVCDRIKKHKDNASRAVYKTLQELIQTLSALDDEYLSHRAPDIADIEKRLLNNLDSKRPAKNNRRRSGVVVAKGLEPSQTASMDPKMILGLVVETGGPTSHTAIMSRALKIPALVGISNITEELKENQFIIIDGSKGVVFIDPTPSVLEQYRKKKRYADRISKRNLKEDAMLPCETFDGRQIHISANIEFISEIDNAITYGAQDIGLYRTEFLILDKHIDEICEEEQYQNYIKAIKSLNGKRLCIRTFDLGADKQSPFTASLGIEDNPFLGCRSIRLCIEQPNLFKQQLRAILRASASGPIDLMIPMISRKSEILFAKKIINEIKKELKSKKVKFDENIRIGIMMEVPSAVYIAEDLAEEVDFFSIGTNDLIQYSLAVDRGNQRVAHMYTPHHPAILRMIKDIVIAANKFNIDVCVCGEMGGDITYTQLLIGLGLKHLSVTYSTIPQIKKIIRSLNFYESRAFADELLRIHHGELILERIIEKNKKIFPKELQAS